MSDELVNDDILNIPYDEIYRGDNCIDGTDLVIITSNDDAIIILATIIIDGIDKNPDDAIIMFLVVITIDVICNNTDDVITIVYGTDFGTNTIDAM